MSWYQSLESNYSNHIEVFKANQLYGTGNITGGYDDYYVRITNESRGLHKPEVLFLGSPHGDETAGTISMFWFTEWLMRKALTDEPCSDYSKDWLHWLLNNREIYFEVSHNPYGFDYDQRYDANGWDLNREADFNGPGSGTGGIWASVQGKTLVRFVNNHTIRVGCDFHGGTRLLIYPWASTHGSIYGTSPITSETYEGAPPDFNFFDVSSLRLGSYMGNPSGDGFLDEDSVGTIDSMIWYTVQGGMTPWGYAADVISNPNEDPYVEDEIFGNYPGAGILWVTPEMSYTKNPSESTFGNDTTPGFGWEVRRYLLHQTDLAQPYVRWMNQSPDYSYQVPLGTSFNLSWQVNGSLVVDHTYLQWGTDDDPINNFTHTTPDHDQHAGDYTGGTGWENAYEGMTNGTTYVEPINFSTPGEYYFVAKAQVDQIYKNVLAPGEYGNTSYLRIVKERTNDSYYESLNGTDGLEEINGQLWWYSPIIKVTVGSNRYPLSNLSDGWNLIAPSFNQSFVKSDIMIQYNGTNYSWSEAIDPENNLIDGNLFGWNSMGQSYTQLDTVTPGKGIWLYSYESCKILIKNISTFSSYFITNMNLNWNCIGLPGTQALHKTNLSVMYDDETYTWSNATTSDNPTNAPLIDANIFSWDKIEQTYVLSDMLIPSQGYWMYSYQNCSLSYP